jgi:TPR repeat protein
MRCLQIFSFLFIFFCFSNAGTLKAEAYLRGFQALEQRDYETALYYLSFFAANGDAKAQYNLGLMYRDGLGVKKDDVQSLTHFLEAAENGHMLGNYAVGLAFLIGKGSDINAEAAIHYLTEAALLGHAISPVEIGHLYFQGALIEKDFVSAHFWWSLADDRNAPGSSENLNVLLSKMSQKQKRQAFLLKNKCKNLTLRQCVNQIYKPISE